MGTKRIVVELTAKEASVLLTMATSADAGDLYELLDRDSRACAAAERALAKLRKAVNTP